MGLGGYGPNQYRNKALLHAEGNFIAFIDDDEFPEDDWLCNLFKACMRFGVDGVLGPVNPHFEIAHCLPCSGSTCCLNSLTIPADFSHTSD
jgi:hypothetical protein